MGKRLSKPIDEKLLFTSADSFLVSGNALFSQPPENVIKWFGIAGVACMAFSIEAYFKVLAQLEHGKPPLNSHNLLKLYEDLSAQSQKEIEDDWNAKVLPSNAMLKEDVNRPAGDFPFRDTLRESLDQAARAFIAFRYELETSPAFNLNTVPGKTREIILRLRPDLDPDRPPISPIR